MSLNFPSEFLSFLRENSIDVSFYNTHLRKFFFVTDGSVSREEIQNDIPDSLESPFSRRCFSTSPSFVFKASHLYSEAKILPIDGASVMAVLALELQKDDNVLDLCCAPGAKLVLLSSLLRDLQGCGSVTGVDVAKSRLETCRALAKKYRLARVRLFLHDGRTFNAPPHLLLSDSREKPFSYPKRSEPFYSSSDYRKGPGVLLEGCLYDKVIVDAPCTHDGSVKHVQKLENCSWKSFDGEMLGKKQLSELYELQYRLLERAFQLTKPGGTIVYSTCSLSPSQNQQIVQRLIDTHNGHITPKPLPHFISFSGQSSTIIHPKDHGCGALFLALLIKL